MKPYELMIDDWVYNKNIDKYIQVYPMMISQMFRQTPDATTEEYNIFPIPLEKEQLEANGFEVFDQGGGWYDVWTGYGKDNEDDIEVEFRDDGRIYVKINAPGQGYYFTTWKIRYVHQLQHILRECGYEKQLKLVEKVL